MRTCPDCLVWNKFSSWTWVYLSISEYNDIIYTYLYNLYIFLRSYSVRFFDVSPPWLPWAKVWPAPMFSLPAWAVWVGPLRCSTRGWCFIHPPRHQPRRLDAGCWMLDGPLNMLGNGAIGWNPIVVTIVSTLCHCQILPVGKECWILFESVISVRIIRISLAPT